MIKKSFYTLEKIFKAQTCSKPENDVYANGSVRQNEDAFSILHDDRVFAISDGAGGNGIFAKDWAMTLLAHLPRVAFPNIQTLNDWIGEFWEDFYEQKKQEIIEKSEIHLIDFIKNKFNEEGSFASLLAIWEEKNTIKCVGFGDSTLLVYNTDTKKMDFLPYKDVLLYEKNPFLLNWAIDAQPEGFFSCNFEVKKNIHFYLVTDALAQYLLCAYFCTHLPKQLEIISQKPCKLKEIAQRFLDKKPRFETILEEFQKCLDSEYDFTNFLYEQYKEGFILRDDYTCVFLKYI